MFNIPVISGLNRYSAESSGMMHLNALNASLSSSQRSLSSSSCANCLPSYEEAVSNGPLFGLFNVNGGDTATSSTPTSSTSTHHHHHLHQHHHHHYHDTHNNNNSYIQFPQSYHSPSSNNNNNNEDEDEDADDTFALPTYQEVLFSPTSAGTGTGTRTGTGSGSDAGSRSPGCGSRAGSQQAGGSRDDNAGAGRKLEVEVEMQGQRLSAMTVSSGSSGRRSKSPLSMFLLKSPRLNARSTQEKQQYPEKQAFPTCPSKSGTGKDGRRKQSGTEKSTLSVAKDRLYRVFSPMLSRKQERPRSSSAKPRSSKAPLSDSEDENIEEGRSEKTSLPLRMYVAPSRPRSGRSVEQQFDSIKGHRGGSKPHKKRSKTPHKYSHKAK